MNAGATAASTVTAALLQAINASGVIVRMNAPDFVAVLRRMEAPLVVHAAGGFFSTKHKYLTSYKGLAFYAVLKAPLDLPAGTEVIEAEKIWVPEM
jgi:hypothetical protein